MAPSLPAITSHLRQLIYYHLDNHLLKNALFLAQRLIAYDPRSGEASYLLALCQYQSGLTKAAWDTSRLHAAKGSHLGCCYMFALACLELARYVDGLAALERSRHWWQGRNTWGQHSETRRQHLPDAAAVWCLKGKLCKAHGNLDEAVTCWATALKINPFMWDAYLELCASGAKISVPNVYRLNPEMVSMTHAANKENVPVVVDKGSNQSSFQTQTNGQPNHVDPFMSTQKVNGNHGSSVLFEKLNNRKINTNAVGGILDEEAMNTPSTVANVDDVVSQNGLATWEAPSAPVRKPKASNDPLTEPVPRYRATSTRAKSRLRAAAEESLTQEPPPPGPPSKRTISGHVASHSHSQSQLSTHTAEPARRSTRLQTSRPPSADSVNKAATTMNPASVRDAREIRRAKAPAVKSRTAASTAGRVVSGNRMRTANADVAELEGKESRIATAAAVNASSHQALHQRTRVESQADKELDALRTLLDLFGRLGSAQLSLSHYDCATTIQIYNSLPSAQRDTPYVLSQIGKAHYEQGQYAEAERYFIRVRQLAPSRLEDMEVYSTTLWHMKSEIELAYLAHELVAVERLSPQAWVAIGNSFSLQREHESALKCFRRATQLDPQFSYGFTLQGHEYIANEEFEKALEAYRSAIAADNRHYNAWYGLGKVYEKMGKWAVAQRHYRTAAELNPSNAVLVCCIGMVLEKLKQPDRALAHYTKACELAPKSALSRFKKARCLMTLGQPHQALEELNVLKTIAPDEANVWFLMGRLHKTLRQRDKAVKAFTMALNLDPKAGQFIKDAMESLEDDDDFADEDEEMNS